MIFLTTLEGVMYAAGDWIIKCQWCFIRMQETFAHLKDL